VSAKTKNDGFVPQVVTLAVKCKRWVGGAAAQLAVGDYRHMQLAWVSAHCGVGAVDLLLDNRPASPVTC
jgi:hypothetical protein